MSQAKNPKKTILYMYIGNIRFFFDLRCDVVVDFLFFDLIIFGFSEKLAENNNSIRRFESTQLINKKTDLKPDQRIVGRELLEIFCFW